MMLPALRVAPRNQMWMPRALLKLTEQVVSVAVNQLVKLPEQIPNLTSRRQRKRGSRLAGLLLHLMTYLRRIIKSINQKKYSQMLTKRKPLLLQTSPTLAPKNVERKLRTTSKNILLGATRTMLFYPFTS